MLASVSVFVDVSCDLTIMGMLIQGKLTRPDRQSAWELRCGYFIEALLSTDDNCTVTDGQWWSVQVYSVHRNVFIPPNTQTALKQLGRFFLTPCMPT